MVRRSMFLISGGTSAGRGFCRPLPYHLGTAPLLNLIVPSRRIVEHKASWKTKKSGAGDGI
jgi:hypothetical protein